MKNYVIALYLVLFAVVATISQAQAQQLPWAAEWARTISLKKSGVTGKNLTLQFGYTKKAFLGTAFKDMNELIAKLTGDPNAFITPEFMNFYMGYEFIGHTDYSDKQEDLQVADDAELADLYQRSSNHSLKIDDMKNNRRWIRIVRALDKEEINCIGMSVINGVVGGCSDVWQGGLTEDEVVCHNGFNYLKCHIGCLNKIYNREAPVTDGFCPEKK